jgi:PPM family protein phosphatase
VITRALGTEADVDVDTFSVEARVGDLFLLCSDGLTTMVDDETILGAVEESSTLDEAAKTLVNAANRGGGEDNITVIFFEVGGPSAAEPAEELGDTAVREEAVPDLEDTIDESDRQPAIAVAEPEPEQRSRVLPILAAVAVLLIMAAAVLWLLGQA